MTPRAKRRLRPAAALRRLCAWLTGTAYRPERHYMRGGARAAGESRPARRAERPPPAGHAA
ncbi:hypothetical protein [Crenalkalicoccus roseus]|uniref:hypothetical protein n=1 Tax=Crenalkalicoccus roseus TaxID=1485588 RepID=UPI0010805346|nr:hypothetical protein [Crenalkalicoccus roseus]